MHSYQPVSVGIPVSQNPYASVPYSQSFPDEPEVESSQQHPLHNQPQNRYPSLNNYGYGQQQPQPPVIMGQPGQFYGAPQGFNQPPQFMMVPIDPERRELDMKISDLGKELDNGWYFVYKVYLYINIVGNILAIVQLAPCLAIFPMFPDFKGTPATIAIIAILILISLAAWGLHFSLVLKNAMSNKNLTAAQRGLKSLIGYSIYNFVITIGLIGGAEYVRTTLPEFREENWTQYYVQAFLYLCVVPTVLTIFGAKKILDLLIQRDTLIQKLNTRFGANMA